MSKRYIYKPNSPMDDSYVVAEFANIMPLLEKAHKCPVRLVKTKGVIWRYAVYELIQTKGGTMSNIKCPFCKKELKLIGEKSDSGYPIDEYFCGCPQTAFHFGNTSMWNELRVLHDDLEEWRESCKVAEKELIRTRKELEQSETCCTEWEKQALDYKAKNIALSGELERTRKALDVALDEINKIKIAAESVGIGFFMTAAISALAKIKTAQEQKDVK